MCDPPQTVHHHLMAVAAAAVTAMMAMNQKKQSIQFYEVNREKRISPAHSHSHQIAEKYRSLQTTRKKKWTQNETIDFNRLAIVFDDALKTAAPIFLSLSLPPLNRAEKRRRLPKNEWNLSCVGCLLFPNNFFPSVWELNVIECWYQITSGELIFDRTPIFCSWWRYTKSANDW